jgi:PAS domain S-box-containing protein
VWGSTQAHRGSTLRMSFIDALRRDRRHYLFALGGTIAAYLFTIWIPPLRERLTFFAFWPLVFFVTWFGGAGPGLLATATSLIAVLIIVIPQGNAALSITAICIFAAVGAACAAIARWKSSIETSLRRSNDLLRESRDRFRDLADSAPVPIWMAGPDAKRTYFSKPWLAFTGRTLEEEAGDGWLEGVHPDDRSTCIEKFGSALAAKAPFEIEFRLRRRDGEYRLVLDHAAPRLADDGTFIGYVGSAVDITEQREAFKRVEESLAEAEAANRSKDTFLATVSHELRTPLSPILAWVRMLSEGKLSAEQRERALKVIERNAWAQAQIIEDLLDVSRIVEGKMHLQVRMVVLQDVIESALDTIRTAADAKGIRVHAMLDSTTPPIAGDPDRLRQVLWNLLSNAVKFTPKGGRVQVLLERVNSHLEISVKDTGEGMGPHLLPHLFKRFWQADSSTTRTHMGLGLGLAIVRHITELHGGTVLAQSAGPDQGSTFTVRLPLVPYGPVADEPRFHPTRREPEPRPQVSLSGLRLLLVDDEPDSNEVIRVFLTSLGADVRVAASAAQAREILSRWPPDVLVCDIGMPEEDGYAFIANLRQSRRQVSEIPAVALTAFASVDDRVRLLAAGFQIHVAKPADPGELSAAIAAVARRTPAA